MTALRNELAAPQRHSSPHLPSTHQCSQAQVIIQLTARHLAHWPHHLGMCVGDTGCTQQGAQLRLVHSSTGQGAPAGSQLLGSFMITLQADLYDT